MGIWHVRYSKQPVSNVTVRYTFTVTVNVNPADERVRGKFMFARFLYIDMPRKAVARILKDAHTELWKHINESQRTQRTTSITL